MFFANEPSRPSVWLGRVLELYLWVGYERMVSSMSFTRTSLALIRLIHLLDRLEALMTASSTLRAHRVSAYHCFDRDRSDGTD